MIHFKKSLESPFMKKIFIAFAFIAWHHSTWAQPVISNGNNLPTVGYLDTLASVTSSTTLPGSGGANVTWNFGSLTPTQNGTFKMVQPSTTPFSSMFPNATHADQQVTFGGSTVYEYWKVTAGKMEMLGSYFSSTTGNNYSSNPKTHFSFPCNYGNSFTDTFQIGTNSPQTVVVTYDGWGKITTPYGTWTNVARFKRDYGGGDVEYEWYTATPYLRIVAKYRSVNTSWAFISKRGTTGVITPSPELATIRLFPNPATQSIQIDIQSTQKLSAATMFVVDASGKMVREIELVDNHAEIVRNDLPSGMYFISVWQEGNKIGNAQFLFH